MKIEFYVLLNSLRFSLRHVRYLVILLYIYIFSLLNWRKTRLTRYGFVFLQIIDDIVDGDRSIDQSPVLYVDALQSQLKKGEFGNRAIDRLAQAFYIELEKRITNSENPVEMAIRVIENMKRDYPRRLKRTWYGESELKSHMRETFELSMDLMLIAMGSKIRSRDIPGLIEGLAWCSMRRDLKNDLAMGIINIPSEILVQSGLNQADLLNYPLFIHNPVIESYLRREHSRIQKCMLDFQGEKSALANRFGMRFIRVFEKSIYKYLAKDEKKFFVLHEESHLSF